jgi:hypothetical protein
MDQEDTCNLSNISRQCTVHTPEHFLVVVFINDIPNDNIVNTGHCGWISVKMKILLTMCDEIMMKAYTQKENNVQLIPKRNISCNKEEFV